VKESQPLPPQTQEHHYLKNSNDEEPHEPETPYAFLADETFDPRWSYRRHFDTCIQFGDKAIFLQLPVPGFPHLSFFCINLIDFELEHPCAG